MNIAGVLGIGLVGAFLAITVRASRPELGLAVGLATGCVIFTIMLPELSSFLAEIESLSKASGVEFSRFAVMIKIIGVAYITQFSAEVIKDSGENAIAKKVEFAGKVMILVMTIPILKELILVVLSTLSVV
ncbi:MAG: stage III sporulation protein AD [Ruminococcaceae bacterium]|nr:stage III sporulation protein AD [Oscillospiraceae bacterium]